MEFSLTSYRVLGECCGLAHRTAIDTGNKDAATKLFATLWERLDRESPQDNCDARATFNAAFGRAYHGQLDAPPPPPPPDVRAMALKAVAKAINARKANRDRKSAALDCAAFYARQEA